MADNNDPFNTERLGAINSKLLRQMDPSAPAEMPVITLANGEKLRTGTVAALLHNIRLYDSAETDAERAAITEDMRAPIPVLKHLGLFELFTPDEWMSESCNSEGRKLVGRLAKEEYAKTSK